ncbi:uncharacterized protein COLE_01260 [Cutaneotrichosporon oleaginosum]|uniref:uncharacterized protein n=1 Tax=Cutaneotrichosporon oleaginosum TaxID=879819 RepID=UPI001324C5FB|nr:hypothetical protein COLE_01260 [Cutaneotrichosporon oleaginosum]
MAKPDGKALAQKAIAARDATIPQEYLLPKSAYPLPKNRRGLLESSGILKPKELEIVDLTLIPLAKAIAEKKYTAVEVATAYCKAAAIAQQATNCVLELFQDEALAEAQKLDDHLAKTGKVVGPLHGVPISIKDHIRQKGHAAPCGFLYAVDQIAEEDSHLFKVLRAAGAVPYCRSAWGATLNPWNADLVPGGSTGGEGALLAMRGSPLGVGSDIGGSVRSPAAACGIYSFKPSIGRVPNTGAETLSAAAGYEGIISTLGPMGRSVEDLELIMRIIADAKPWEYDPSLHVKPWREIKRTGKLRIGVLRDDGVVRPVGAINRALEYAVDKLKAAGHEIVEYKPYESETSWDIITKLYFPDGGKLVYDSLKKADEPADPMTDWIVGQGRELDRDEIIDLVARRDKYRMAVAAHWQKAGIDCLLSPVGPTPAPLPFTAKYWNYTSYWNLANYPAGVFPTGLFVDENDKKDTNKPRNEKEEEIYASYDPAKAQGAPLCLQVVGYIGHEEETLDAMKTIVNAVTK